MNSSLHSSIRPTLSCALILLVTVALPVVVMAQEKKTTKSKSDGAAKTAAKSPGAATQFDKHLAANMKLLNVLSRYAECLTSATDVTTAALALDQLEDITREAITAGEAVVKLGRPTPDLEAKLAKDADLQLTSQLVAEKTRNAVKTISANADVKTLLAPGIENFQAALNRIQETADDPQGPGGKPDKKSEAATTVRSSPAPVDPGLLPAETGSGTASAPPPPAPPQ